MGTRGLLPDLTRAELRRLAAMAVGGAVAAGLYGAAHDAVTFTVSPEYFGKFKFGQFPGTAFLSSGHGRAMVVGFLGTWWVGLLLGWFVGRVSRTWREWGKRMVVVFSVVLFAGVAADVWTRSGGNVPMAWKNLAEEKEVRDVGNFLRVCAIHTAGYAGVVIGCGMLAAGRLFR